jgi:hypothetical protein
MTALTAPSVAPAPRRPLHAVASTRPQGATAAAPKLRYIVVTLLGIFAILGAQLMLSIAVSGGAYEIASLKGEMRQTEQKRQMVAEDINALVAPDTLAGLASSMGMVADNNPAYLRLSDASVVGAALPASASAGSQLFPVTSGSETVTVPAIVSAVFESVMTADAADVAPDMAVAAVATTTAPTVATAHAVAEPEIRFGGTIPSPTTR